MADRLDDDAINAALAGLDDWSRVGDTIVREFEFGDFVDAIGFIAKVGVLAERSEPPPGAQQRLQPRPDRAVDARRGRHH